MTSLARGERPLNRQTPPKQRIILKNVRELLSAQR
jgi:hypothetical protein